MAQITVDENDPNKVVPVRLWTSTMKRTVETAQFIQGDTIAIPDRDDPSVVHEWVNLRMRKWPYLDEIFAGTLSDIIPDHCTHPGAALVAVDYCDVM